MFKKDTPVHHAPRAAVIPQGVTVTAWLRDNARHGAMLVTRDGVTVAEIGHATRMVDSDGRTTYNYFAPETTTDDIVARHARVNMKQAAQDNYDGFPTEYFGRTI